MPHRRDRLTQRTARPTAWAAARWPEAAVVRRKRDSSRPRAVRSTDRASAYDRDGQAAIRHVVLASQSSLKIGNRCGNGCDLAAVHRSSRYACMNRSSPRVVAALLAAPVLDAKPRDAHHVIDVGRDEGGIERDG